MEAVIPEHFIQIDRREFELLKLHTQWVRDGYSKGVYFYHRHTGQKFAVELDDGTVFVDPAVGDLCPTCK